MTLKVEGKVWDCKNQCKNNCCSSVWLKISPEQRVSLKNKGYFVAKHDYTDFRWLGYHKQFKIDKLDKGDRKITLRTKDYKIQWNPFVNSDFLYVEDRCIQLKPNNLCKVYRNRPKMCAVGECIVFSRKKSLQWMAENGHLKEAIEKYRKGDLDWH